MKLSSILLLLPIIIYCQACKYARKHVTVTLSPDYQKAEAFYEKDNDSAFFYFNKTATNARDSLLAAMAYSYMGIIQSGAGDYFGSQESLLQSLKHLDERKETHVNCLLSDYNELGRVSLNLKDYGTATYYYDKALHFIDDDNTRIIVLSNKAVAYQKEKRYKQAIAIYDSILYRSKIDQKRHARILSNKAYTQWLADSTYPPVPELMEALSIQQHKKDTWDLNASYAHLSAYYLHANRDSALSYAGKMYAVAQALDSPDDELEALQKLILLNAPDAVKTYFNRYLNLDDSLQTSRNNAKNQFALIRYEVARNKADNLALQKENAEKKWQILLQWFAIALVITTAISIIIALKKRRQRMLREQRLKTSQKVHDVVANGLYHLMSRIQHHSLDQELVLDDLEQLYEQSRNISYDQPEEVLANYHESVSTLLSSYSTLQTKVSIIGNEELTWQGMPESTKNQLQHILRELMVNMKKHSGAGSVVIRFERTPGLLTIRYADDGNGLPAGFSYGNGLRNTENRIAGISGSISFDTSVSTGLKIQLTIPFA